MLVVLEAKCNMTEDTKCSCHTKQMKRSWFVSVGQMIHPSRCFFVCICVSFFVFALPIQEWICVCGADDLSKLMLVHSIEALKREELTLRHFLNFETKVTTGDLGRIPLVVRHTQKIEEEKINSHHRHCSQSQHLCQVLSTP